MKRFITGLLIIFVFLACAFWCARQVTKAHAYKVVANPEASNLQFNSAIEALKPYNEDPGFWLKIASDARYSRERRKQAIKHYFDSFIRGGNQFGQLLTNVGGTPSWISYERITKRGTFTGWMPDVYLMGESAFSIPVLSRSGDTYQLTIYMAFAQNLEVSNVVDAFHGNFSKKVADAVIVGCGTWDTKDIEKRFPYANAKDWQP